MPPNPKFSKEEIVSAALTIVREEGIYALTARELSLKLNSSSRPIFTVFKNMEEVKQAVTNAAKALYGEYVEKGLAEQIAFKGVGMQYILFSVTEPILFRLLFMAEKEEVPALEGVLQLIDENYEKILLSVQNSYGLDETAAKKLYQHLWVYSHGIATLCATKMCRFTSEQISVMITEVCTSLLKKGTFN
ncbi:MAG: TetR/AcrR family transcriptional regulator [Oscillospiraceae bacterium]|nr:TetR/AcrR family transcriptional regulator [Oscillospiraceae bacterium]